MIGLGKFYCITLTVLRLPDDAYSIHMLPFSSKGIHKQLFSDFLLHVPETYVIAEGSVANKLSATLSAYETCN